MASHKQYWKSEAELTNDPVVEQLAQNEFTETLPVNDFFEQESSLKDSQSSRRDFLKFLGFSTAAATLAACEGPVKKSIPYVIQPDEIVPGIANYYATTIADGYDFASVLVKTREGRPIKIENNDRATLFGGANARVQASVLNLYDKNRLQGPEASGSAISWSDLDAAVIARLESAKSTGKKVVVLSGTKASPSYSKAIEALKAKYPNVEYHTYDAISSASALDAFEQAYGERALADYNLSSADIIVSFDADFLGDWQGGGYSKGYAKNRVPHHGHMSHHVQLESNMTLSGANADKRIPLTTVEQKRALAALYNALIGVSASESNTVIAGHVNAMAQKLKAAGSKAVVLCGIDDKDAQLITLAINELLKSDAFDVAEPKYVRSASASVLEDIIAAANKNEVAAILIDGVNPLYSAPNAEAFSSALAQIGFSVTSSFSLTETAAASTFVASASHFLESWGDVEIKKGHYGITQPVIRNLFDTRQFEQSLLVWAGVSETYHDFVQKNWRSTVLNGSSWSQAVQDGVFYSSSKGSRNFGISEGDLQLSSNKLSTSSSNGVELVLYAKTGMGDGQMANNPWLQEFPDPISRASWDNYLTISKADALAYGFENINVANGGLDGSYATLKVGDVTLNRVPVLIQPGQAKGTVGLALGYGRKSGIQEEMQTGVNAYSLYLGQSKVQSVTLEKERGMHEFACVQLHKTLMGRGDIIKETTLEDFISKPSEEWNPTPMVSLDHQEVPATSVDLWESFDRTVGHHFNLSIDLNACTGCGACVIACHAENNVPVVGKHEIRVSRDMHWLRIDRYYSSEETFAEDTEKKENLDGLFGDNGSLSGFGSMEDPSENPQVAFQPVMCQHCNHAPCETVCPVAATSHSRQGQNHMAYNRCIGTRYCANNCPYKVRRFNWFLYNQNDEFDFHMNNDLGRMVLNPDVNVRSRGVMEKCSMCIQRTQKTILDAKAEGRSIKDGEFQTACSAACDTGALVFGDINDKESRVAKLKESERMYHLLEHVGTQPNVFYHVKVRNTEKA